MLRGGRPRRGVPGRRGADRRSRMANGAGSWAGGRSPAPSAASGAGSTEGCIAVDERGERDKAERSRRGAIAILSKQQLKSNLENWQTGASEPHASHPCRSGESRWELGLPLSAPGLTRVCASATPMKPWRPRDRACESLRRDLRDPTRRGGRLIALEAAAQALAQAGAGRRVLCEAWRAIPRAGSAGARPHCPRSSWRRPR